MRYDAMRVNDSDLHRFQGVEVEDSPSDEWEID